MIKRLTILFILLTGLNSLLQAQYKAAEISRVTINPETNITTIYFTGTDHPDVSFYYVMEYDYQSAGALEPDGEPIPSSYTPDNGDPDYLYSVSLDIEQVTQRSVGFYIRPYQDVNTPLTDYSGSIDSTVYLSVSMDECLNSATLNWNDYNGWRDHILAYRVMLKIDDENPTVLTELPEGQTTYTVTGLQGGMRYLFFIHTRRTDLDPDSYVLSNGVSDSIATLYPEYIHADFGTVGGGNKPELQFSIDPNTDIETYALLRSSQAQGTYDTIAYLNAVNGRINYTDTEADASTQPYYYRLVAVNFCQKPITVSENIAGTIYLQGELEGTSVGLDWTAYQDWPAGVADYELERMFEGEEAEILPGISGLHHTDNLEDFRTSEHANRVCYRVRAIENPGGEHSPEPASSTSNQFCINLPLNIEFTFDAFMPESAANRDFGPTMDFIPLKYDFKIFNRSGTQVFHSEDPFNTPRWDGHLQNGSLAPQGVYRYTLYYEDEYGNRVVLQNKVTLVRQ